MWCLVILPVFTFRAHGVSPYLYRWSKAFLVLSMQFAAGVFLSTTLVHFLTDSASTSHGLTGKNNHGHGAPSDDIWWPTRSVACRAPWAWGYATADWSYMPSP